MTTRLVGEGVQLEGDLVENAQIREEMRAERDHLDVRERLGDTHQLDADLVELAKPAFLRPLVAKHRPGVKALDGQTLAERAADQGARHAGGVFRP